MGVANDIFSDKKKEIWRMVLFYAAPILFIIFAFFIELNPEQPTVGRAMGVALWMALWWVAEIVPLAITSLLPIVLFPLLGVMDGKDVSSAYFNHVIFLFIGGFIIALAIERWNLHKRIATKILLSVGVSPGKLLFGFMFATAFLSMWISNTATTMMMIPILISIIKKMEAVNGRAKVYNFSIGLLLATAYSASIGGIATLVGTPPNLSFARIFHIYFPEAPEITFSGWFLFALPLSILMFALLYVYIYLVFIKRKRDWTFIQKESLKEDLSQLGKITYEEKVIGVIFFLLALLWLTRSNITIGEFTFHGWSNLFSNPKFINDGTVAIMVALVLFVIPSKKDKNVYLMGRQAIEDIPWEIVLLFGGGFALANGFKESGLSTWIGEQLIWLKSVHPMLIILCIALIVTFLTELTSNTATVETFLPILAGLSISIEVNPLLFMIPATLAGSMAFMLPVATPPNAIVFGTRRLRVSHMMKTGIFLNIAGSIILTLFVYHLSKYFFDIDLESFPAWAFGKH